MNFFSEDYSHKEQEKQEMFPSSCLLLYFVANINSRICLGFAIIFPDVRRVPHVQLEIERKGVK